MSSQNETGNVGRIMKDKNSRRMLAVSGLAILGAAGFFFLGGSGAADEKSAVKAPPSMSDAQGAKEVSEQYRQGLQKANTERAQQASKSGGSAMPTIVLTSTGDKLPSTLDGKDEKGRDMKDEVPERPVPKAEPPKPAPAQTPQAKAAAPAQPAAPAIDKDFLAALMRQMAGMQKDFTAIRPADTKWFYVADQAPASKSVGVGQASGFSAAQPLAGGQGAAPGAAPALSAAFGQQAQQAHQSKFQAPTAGTILYSRLVGRVNSDVPGPVVAEVLQGPFAGSRLLGAFQFSEEGVVINFTSMTVPYAEDGESRSEVVPIKAVAVDTAHLGSALATDIDRHLLSKVGFAFATAFLQGLGQAVSQSGSTTVTYSSGTTTSSNPLLSSRDKLLVAGGTAAASAGQQLQQVFGNRKTTITVEADTPFGLLFLGTAN